MTQGTDRGGAPAESVADVGTSGDGSGVDEGPFLSLEIGQDESIVEFKPQMLQKGEWTQTKITEWLEENVTDMDRAEEFGRYVLRYCEGAQLILGLEFLHVEKHKGGGIGLKGGRRELGRRLHIPKGTASDWSSMAQGRQYIEDQWADFRPLLEEAPMSHYKVIAKSPDKPALISFYNDTIKETGKLPTYSKAMQRVRRQVRDVTEPVPLPEGVFNVIYADPPWKYDFSETDSRKVENQYLTMELADIKALFDDKEASKKVADNAVLFLWATAPKLEEALEVMEAWGFEYKTHAIWDKEIIGMGYWFRGQHELLLVGTRGVFSPPEEDTRISSVIHCKREGHSKKPEAVYDIIEGLCSSTNHSELKYLELFARNERKNWTSWGDEL